MAYQNSTGFGFFFRYDDVLVSCMHALVAASVDYADGEATLTPTVRDLAFTALSKV
jgi:hypothetical protein